MTTSPKRTHRTFLTLVALLLFSNCSGLQSLSDLSRLQRRLQSKYHDQVGVNLQNSRYLSISFINSSLNRSARAEREKRASETAKFVVDNYSDINQIGNVGVAFVESNTTFLVFHSMRVLDWFLFDKRGEAIRPDIPTLTSDGSEEDPGAPALKYNPGTNKTDVSIMRVQLEGDLNQGVALTPHFFATGNIKEGKLSPPPLVMLDFASYSNQKVFSGNPQLQIKADNVAVYTGPGRLLPANESGAQQNIAQFVSAGISFEQFAQMAGAQAVTITLGKKKFELTEAQIASLRKMRSYVVEKRTASP